MTCNNSSCAPWAFTVVHDASTVWLWESGSVLGCCHSTTFSVALEKMHAPSKDDIWFRPMSARLIHKLFCWICVWADGPACACACVFFPFWQGTLHHPYISFYDSFYLIHHPLMTSYPTWLERERAVYPTAALTSPIFISIFGNKTVMLSSINNLSTLLYQAAISVHGGAPAFWIILLQDGAPPNERLIDSLLTFFDYATFQENLIWNVDRTT